MAASVFYAVTCFHVALQRQKADGKITFPVSDKDDA